MWLIDPKGGKGKTELAKYLYSKEPEKWLIMKDPGTTRDAATIVQNSIEQGWQSHGVILDLPRQAQTARTRIYPILEEIKDGFITATKYQGGTTTFPIPHVTVFANWGPTAEALSMDRWDIREITEDGELKKLDSKDFVSHLINFQ